MKKLGRSLFKHLQCNLLKSFLILGLIAFVFTGVGYNGGLAFAKSKQFPTLVTTQYGEIQGSPINDDTIAWKGVPFAEPPVGDLRWKAPQDLVAWPGVWDATANCAPCTQLITWPNWIRTGTAEGSEDCLYLNIYRPRTDKKNLPVYVWIHGGGNNFGKALHYDGSAIATRSNMVMVVLQYRLGPLGWFYHPALQGVDSLTDSGNFGTLDNIKALEWIQENIEAFGGNPDNVTITGESAGAHNVMNLVISPLAAGLFHRAVSQSGGMATDSLGDGLTQANATIAALMVFDGTVGNLPAAYAKLAIMSASEIQSYLMALEDAGDLLETYFASYGTLPMYDAYRDLHVIPGSVVATIRSGNYNKVPIILGANQYETKAFMPLYGPYLGWPSWWDLRVEVLDGDKTLDEVLSTPFEKELYEVTGYYGSRNWRAKFVDERARALKEQQERVYAYQFNWGGPGSGEYPFDFISEAGSGKYPFNFIYGAGHAMEIPFFHGGDKSMWGYSFSPGNDTAGRVALQNAMMAYLANFSKTGNPNGAGLPVWQKWNNEEGESKVIVFDANFDEALLKMSDEEVTFGGVAAELGAAIGAWDPADQIAWGWLPWYFQWYAPE